MRKIIRSIVYTGQHCTITEQQFRTLVNLKRNDRISLKELGKTMMISSPSLCIMLNKLHEQGLVVRESGRNDRRNAYFRLSECGERLLGDEMKRRTQYVAARMEMLDAEDRDRLVECLDAVEVIMEKLDAIL